MKRKLLTGLAFLTLLLTINSCTTYDDYLSEQEVRRLIEQAIKDYDNEIFADFTKWHIAGDLLVKQNEWRWNENLSQFEATIKIPELSQTVYDYGAVLAYVYIGDEDEDEVQKPLEYTNTYTYIFNDDEGEFETTLSETINYEYSVGQVKIIIKSSGLIKDDYAPQQYYFRMILLW